MRFLLAGRALAELGGAAVDLGAVRGHREEHAVAAGRDEGAVLDELAGLLDLLRRPRRQVGQLRRLADLRPAAASATRRDRLGRGDAPAAAQAAVLGLGA